MSRSRDINTLALLRTWFGKQFRDYAERSVLESEQARQRGSVPRPFIFVVTVLTPATTETEDPPTVSLAPQYTSQHTCHARLSYQKRWIRVLPKQTRASNSKIQLTRQRDQMDLCNFYTTV
jgi:hypothetical protein